MRSMRSTRTVVIYLIALISVMGMSACGKTGTDTVVTEPAAVVTGTDAVVTEPVQTVPDYTERRLQALPGELSMETTTEEWNENEEFVSYVYRLPENEDFLKMWVEDEQEPGKILLNGQEYPYSFGDYYPRGGENPQVYVADLNGDGEPDVLMKGEAYPAQIRQEVYLSDGAGGYRELGDVTWRSGSLEEFPFTVSYEDDYRIHVAMPAYDIDQTVQMQTGFSELAQELDIYDENGKVTEYGRGYIEQPNLQSQAVRYLQADDGSVTLRYEAQIEAGYSEYCLGWCFVFIYEITEEGYKLQSVTLEEFPY